MITHLHLAMAQILCDTVVGMVWMFVSPPDLYVKPNTQDDNVKR